MKFLRPLVALFLLAVLTGVSLAQEYRATPGEVVMKVEVEGRGNIFVRLYTKEAPKATNRIISLAKTRFYDGQRFHKVVRSPRPFIAQIGDPESRDGNLDDPAMGTHGAGARIPYEETGISHEEGVVALAAPARDRDGGDCQFFFVLDSSRFLDGKYTVFGRVVEGIDVMRTLQKGDRVASVSIVGR